MGLGQSRKNATNNQPSGHHSHYGQYPLVPVQLQPPSQPIAPSQFQTGPQMQPINTLQPLDMNTNANMMWPTSVPQQFQPSFQQPPLYYPTQIPQQQLIPQCDPYLVNQYSNYNMPQPNFNMPPPNINMPPPNMPSRLRVYNYAPAPRTN